MDSVVSAQLVAGAVVSRPWGSGTVARVLTVVDYSLILSDRRWKGPGDRPRHALSSCSKSPVLNERLWSEGTEVKFIGVTHPFVRSIEYDVGGLSIISQED